MEEIGKFFTVCRKKRNDIHVPVPLRFQFSNAGKMKKILKLRRWLNECFWSAVGKLGSATQTRRKFQSHE